LAKVITTAEALGKINQYQLPKELPFGKVIGPVIVESDFADGQWGPLKLVPHAALALKPEAKVFHYGQEIFEGLKAYYVDKKGPYLFRPEQNAERFNLSAYRMGMADFPVPMFLASVHALSSALKNCIPQKSGESLYLRPTMVATEESLGIKPSSTYKYILLASPSGPYFTGDSIKVYIERDRARACPGGIGRAKTGGNYAASILSAKKAIELGCAQTLWLDALKKSYIEEMSGMNFMAIINGEVVTPAMTDTILDGVTRKSILDLGRSLGYKTREEKMSINDLLGKIETGECTEAFACGTAAIITPIRAFCEADGKEIILKPVTNSIAMRLRQELLDRQEGRKDAPLNWRVPVQDMEF